MPTVRVNKKTYILLKKISGKLGVPMSAIVERSIIDFMEKMGEKGELPPELELEAMYLKLMNIYRYYRMAKAIMHWYHDRLEDLISEAEMIGWKPIKAIINSYRERIERIYEELDKKFGNSDDEEEYSELAGGGENEDRNKQDNTVPVLD